MPEKFKTDGILIWPVYVNFTIKEWEVEEIEYARQAFKACNNALMINSLSVNPNCYGDCFYFQNGKIKKLDFDTEGIISINL